MKRQINRYVVLLVAMLVTTVAYAVPPTPHYFMEFGLHGGASYYVGDLHEHIFMNPRYAAGAQVNVKFNRRWSVTAKAQYIDIAFPKEANLKDNILVGMDVVAEYNFFRFDMKQYDPRIKPLTPYIFLGVGYSMYGYDEKTSKRFGCSAPYIPFGLGLKWKMAPRWTMTLAWQHQLYLFLDADNLEDDARYNNTYELNRGNFLRNDMVSTFTLGITFAFIKKKGPCNCCD